MAFIRNVEFPAVGSILRHLGKTNEGIETREIKVFAGGVSDQVIDIIADLHMGGVHNRLNATLVHSQKRAQEIIGETPCIELDLGDRLTLGSGKDLPTQGEDLVQLGDYFYAIARRGEGEKIWGVNGNHDRRILEKMSADDFGRLETCTRIMGFKQIMQPVELGKGRIKLHGMPCFNTQIGLYTPESVRELIGNINKHSGVNIVMVHNPDGVRQIEAIKKQEGLRINIPTLFLCGHTHGLLGFRDIPIFGKKLSLGARKWIGMKSDTLYISGYYPATTGEPYGIFVSQGMGDGAGVFRIGNGGRERAILRFVDKRKEADIVLV